MSPTQEKLLLMLSWFNDFCRKYNLKYYAVGGTLLGAVRHKGFIPWDDDIDLCMPRDDYEKLYDIMGTSVWSHYVLETVHSEDPAYCYTFSKLYDTETTLIENVRSGIKRGIYLDIFPFDGLGSSKEPDIKLFKKINERNQLFLARVSGIRTGRAFYKNLAVRIIGSFPESILNTKKMRLNIDTLCKYYKYEESLWVGNLLGNWGQREIVAKSVIGEPTEYMFEGAKIFGVEKYDEYLTSIYGNWRELPPVEKQVSHHDYIYCNLNEPYIEV